MALAYSECSVYECRCFVVSANNCNRECHPPIIGRYNLRKSNVTANNNNNIKKINKKKNLW